MSTSKHIDKICALALVLSILLGILFMNSEAFGVTAKPHTMGYENRIFDSSKVHSIDIVMDSWDSFIETCTNEEYSLCSVVIDGEAFKNVAIRAKGNTSLSSVSAANSERYSFKIEFDHYDSTNSYHGLDKLSLNNIIQDNTYMKDYLVYTMMNDFGVASPLCSYVNITVNGEAWGLYLAVEAVEESFMQRNYGNDYGELYKPDSMSMGGGRGNGMDFDISQLEDMFGGSFSDFTEGRAVEGGIGSKEASDGTTAVPDAANPGAIPDMGGFEDLAPDMGSFGGGGGGNFGGGFSMGGDDVSLVYSDDSYSSYSNIFNNAKTDITDSDKDRLIAALKNMNEQTDLSECVDIEQVIRYFVVHNFVLNFDSYTGSIIHNYYLYEDDGLLSMIPWDYNLAFGGFQASSDATSLVNYPIDSPVSGGSADSRPMLAWILENEEYLQMYHTLFSELMDEYFSSGYFNELIDSTKALIAPYVESDPTKFCTYEEFELGVDTLKEFCLLRAESIKGQLEGTIGSTSSAQADSAGFIDASHLTVSDMGSMSGSMGGGMGNFGGRGDKNEAQRPQNGEGSDSGEEKSEIGNASPSGGEISVVPTASSGSGDFSLPDFSSGIGTLPEDFSGTLPDDFTGTMPEDFSGTFPDISGEGSTPPDGTNPNGSNSQSGTQRLNNMPSGIFGDTAATGGENQLLLLIVSSAVLIGGLVFAFLFKRRV